MAKFRLACHLIQFGGEQNQNPEKVFREVAEAGWDGLEGIGAKNADELVSLATLARKYGLHIVNVGGPPATEKVKYNITLGNGASETPGLRRADWGGPEPSDADF